VREHKGGEELAKEGSWSKGGRKREKRDSDTEEEENREGPSAREHHRPIWKKDEQKEKSFERMMKTVTTEGHGGKGGLGEGGAFTPEPR